MFFSPPGCLQTRPSRAPAWRCAAAGHERAAGRGLERGVSGPVSSLLPWQLPVGIPAIPLSCSILQILIYFLIKNQALTSPRPAILFLRGHRGTQPALGGGAWQHQERASPKRWQEMRLHLGPSCNSSQAAYTDALWIYFGSISGSLKPQFEPSPPQHCPSLQDQAPPALQLEAAPLDAVRALAVLAPQDPSDKTQHEAAFRPRGRMPAGPSRCFRRSQLATALRPLLSMGTRARFGCADLDPLQDQHPRRSCPPASQRPEPHRVAAAVGQPGSSSSATGTWLAPGSHPTRAAREPGAGRRHVEEQRAARAGHCLPLASGRSRFY